MTKTKKTKKKIRSKKRIFTRKDFVSGDGMVVALWGPAMWHSLHTISFNYPIHPTKEEKKHYKEFITNLTHVLPCSYCRKNLIKHLELFPITQNVMKDRNSFSRYIYQLHERINKNLGKNSGLTYCDVRERYEHFRSRCSQAGKMKKEKENKLRSGTNKTRKNKEKGCTEPLYGKKAKCIIQIVPKDKKCPTFQVDETCKKRKIMG